MDLGLKDKVAWVLGASSGLGRATARALAAEGASVAISARRKDLLEKEAGELAELSGTDAFAAPLDVSDHDSIPGVADSIRERLGPVDILIANAGGPPPGTFGSLSDEDMLSGFDLTTASAWHLTRAVVPGMKERGSGAIVFVTSYSTKEIVPALLLSNMMRAAVVGFAKSISKELGPHGIQCCARPPGGWARIAWWSSTSSPPARVEGRSMTCAPIASRRSRSVGMAGRKSSAMSWPSLPLSEPPT